LRAGFALNVVSSPVKGLTPLRALVAGFLTTLILIKPGRLNMPALRDFRVFAIMPCKEPSTASTCLRLIPVSVEIWVSISDLVGGFFVATAAFCFVAIDCSSCNRWTETAPAKIP
jgi:hypothetical protein